MVRQGPDGRAWMADFRVGCSRSIDIGGKWLVGKQKKSHNDLEMLGRRESGRVEWDGAGSRLPEANTLHAPEEHGLTRWMQLAPCNSGAAAWDWRDGGVEGLEPVGDGLRLFVLHRTGRVGSMQWRPEGRLRGA